MHNSGYYTSRKRRFGKGTKNDKVIRGLKHIMRKDYSIWVGGYKLVGRVTENVIETSKNYAWYKKVNRENVFFLS